MTQGQSSYTQFKLERFGPVLAQSLKISTAEPVKRFPYYHIDLNAGGGYNHEVGVPGSPLNFLGAVARHRRDNVFVFLVDHDATCIRELIAQPDILAFRRDRLSIHHADNAEIFDLVSERIIANERKPQYAMGSIVIDPNGYHNGVPWDALKVFCKQYPRMDLFFNLNIRCFRLERPHILAARHEAWRKKQLHPLSEFPAWFTRRHWMWTQPCQIKGNTWVQGVARTMETHTAGYSSLGFYDSQSERGRAILQSIDAPRNAINTPLLFDV